MAALLLQAKNMIVIEPSQSSVVIDGNLNIKGIRVDQSGVLTVDLESGDSDDMNVLQGEFLNVTGGMTLSTDGTCRVQVKY